MVNTPSKTSILLVDDEISFCRQAQVYLSAEGHDVHTLSDGNEVLNSVQKIEPNILVLDLDLGLTDTDGRLICSEISQTEIYRQGRLGIILISGQYIKSTDELLGYSAGADNYLVKPFDMSQLCVRIEAVYRRLTRGSAGTPNTGDLSIDFDRREVRIQGNEIRLPKLEFDLLAFLIKADGAVCVKGDLLEYVWRTVHVEEGAIPKCVSLLRKRLSRYTEHQYIENVFGVGYKFVPDNKNG